MLFHFTDTVKVLWCLVVIMQLILDAWTFARYIPALLMHRRIIMSHSLATDIKYKLSRSTIGTQIAFRLEMPLGIVIWVSSLPARNTPSQFLCPNPISIWWVARGEIAVVKAYGLNKLRMLNWWQIGLHVGRKWCDLFIGLGSTRY